MSNTPAVQFINVSKSFSRSTGRTLLRVHIADRFRQVRKDPFYALKNISCHIEFGESVAVVGPNGAGKSTLLSLVAGLAIPDSGRVIVNGRVAPLLELGSGFHPDLTGVENLYLNAALLGLGKNRTDQLVDAIVEFAGIADFINEPLRTYSAGMIMRLAFSVAVSMDPDILIIDEFLTVGDQAFQAKCMEKIFEFRHAGKTILCVSHTPGLVQRFCARAIWLDHGELVMDGKTADIMEAYFGRLPSSA